ncbi:MAG: hypothetical protein KAT68_00690 [Bacteroidales bacterium]|nr:hypothetical protein [Bacteroidales bacterium]
MGFVQKKTKIEIIIPYLDNDSEKVTKYIEDILSNTDINDLRIMSEISKRPQIKKMALNAANKFIN